MSDGSGGLVILGVLGYIIASLYESAVTVNSSLADVLRFVKHNISLDTIIRTQFCSIKHYLTSISLPSPRTPCSSPMRPPASSPPPLSQPCSSCSFSGLASSATPSPASTHPHTAQKRPPDPPTRLPLRYLLSSLMSLRGSGEGMSGRCSLHWLWYRQPLGTTASVRGGSYRAFA